ncbi:oxidoreductase, FAD/FMN-binding protein [Fulvimarina pelagi HTCC2506]|uniref:Oxidoreductase, FAD/FMN-binding protein n=2 Tax=Fulvimarina pelagi TaxID=217511 RepID=Q0FZB9_9HYPH|nr:NADH:flavin oxidoreductase [Fulvimarina pelagi]EAU40359.1 oxidoreductase, FAD/FMN-binding protein [Fulvimarina pelagi HTCC2506]BAT31396.1 oxidoreductase, FAD/FMN-binding protein [Fulvimarina pelagi]
MIANAEALLKPLTIKGMTIRNRVMSTSHAPSFGKDGKPQERYQLYHEEKAKGGIGLTMFGGSSSVSLDSPAAPWNQISVADDSVIPFFQQFSDRVHQHGAKLMIQLTHMGRRTKWDTENWFPVKSASVTREPASRSVSKELEQEEIDRIVRDFAQAARRAREGGLDGCEISAAHGHLVDQFWSQLSNHRTDKYGGSLENRMRFGIEVLTAMRESAGDDYIIGMRMSGDELLKGGLTAEDLIAIASEYASRGLVDFLNVVGGQARDHIAHAVSLPNMSFPVAPYLPIASAVKREVDIPIFHAQRVTDLATGARAVAEGHVDMIAMTRAHIADPHLIKKLTEGRADDIRQCVGYGYCIDRIYIGKDALCIQNAATGREATMPHVIEKADVKKRAVVVGGGVGGLEAARVLAERGHEVTLFEKTDKLGGQVLTAAKATWREALTGIPRWLVGQVQKLGVDIRLNTEADDAAIFALSPDIVIVATGGLPHLGEAMGSEHAISTWDVLEGKVEPSGTVLLYDEMGDHNAASTAEHLAKKGCLVELATHDRMIGEEIGGTNQPVHLRELYNLGVIQTPNMELIEIYPEGNRKIAALRNVMTHQEEERVVDYVVVDYGTHPVDQLHFALKEKSKNAGFVDNDAIVAGKPQPYETNGSGQRDGFTLYRVGDVLAGRNIHAAIYDALRLCKDL